MSPLGIASSYSHQPRKTHTATLWLLLVGVNQYQDSGLRPLRYSAIDCQGLADALIVATSEFTHTESRIYHDFSTQAPNLNNVRSSIQHITNVAQPQDTVLFYFSGHGMLVPDTQQAVLCLQDTQTEKLLETGLPLQELLQILGNCAASQQLVWLDACHSGSMTLRGTAIANNVEILPNPTPQFIAVLQQRAAKSKGFYAMLSCDVDQQSWEFPELGHGVFTYYLMHGLRGEAAGATGLISADKLYRYVYHQTLQYIDKTNQQIRLINQQKRGKGDRQIYSEYPLQTPKRIVEGVGDIIIGKRPELSGDYGSSRVAVVIDGLAGNKTSLEISKVLQRRGGFELEYWQAGKTTSNELHHAIAHHLQPQLTALSDTILLYWRGQIAGTELLLGENIRIQRSWLKQQLRQCSAKQIIILDCPQLQNSEPGKINIQDWLEYLQIDSLAGQCIVAYASPPDDSEQFAQTFLATLMAAGETEGLSVAGWIAKLQVTLNSSHIPLHIWLSGARGILEIVPTKSYFANRQKTPALDLGICPYMGLAAFGEQDSQYFYGRESLTQQLRQHLSQQSFLAVVGASGSGKSSLVKAGLIPQLRLSQPQWWVRVMCPGANPQQALIRELVGSNPTAKAAAQLQLEGILHQGVEGFVYWLRSCPQTVTVLVIDQFEELFTLTSKTDRERFLELVLGAVEYASDRFKVIITLRADFIATALEIPTLAQALQAASILVPPQLSWEDYRRVIVQPAQQVGLQVEPELVEVLLRELNNSAGDLPLLEFVLEQLWQHRVRGELTLQAYQQQVGGFQGALERSCQAVYAQMEPQMQACAKWIFLALTQLGEGTEDTRRRVGKSELVVQKYQQPLVDKTLQALTAAKLVVMDVEEGLGDRGDRGDRGRKEIATYPSTVPSVTVEVAHEILIRHWSTLRWWLEENRERIRKQRQIEHAAQLWWQNGQAADFLLQGVRLAEAQEIYINYTDELSRDMQRYVEAGLAEKHRLQQQEKSRLRQAQRAVVVIGILGLAALGFGILAQQQSYTAQLREIEALNSLSDNFLRSHKQLEALVTSVKAGTELQKMILLTPPVHIRSQTITALQQAVYTTQERNRLLGHQAWVTSVSFSPDGTMIASASWNHTVKLWRRDGLLLHTLKGRDGINNLSFSPNSQIIATANNDNTIDLWSRDGKLRKTLTGHSRGVTSVSFAPDSKTLVSASNDKTLKLWNLEGNLLKTLTGHSRGINSVSFSPDGQLIVSGSDDGIVKLWRRDAKLLKTWTGDSKEILGITFSPDGRVIASASSDKTIKLWNQQGQLLTTFTGHSAAVRSVSFSPNSKLIASTSADKTVKLWSLDGRLLETLAGHSHEVNSVSFSPDSQIVASASDDTTLRLWQLDITVPKTLHGHTDSVTGVEFSLDGGTVISSSDDKTTKLWSRDGRLLQTRKSPIDDLTSATFSTKVNKVALAKANHKIELRTIEGALLSVLTGHHDWVSSMNFSPDGQTLASASADQSIKLWSLDGRLRKTLTGHSSWVTKVRFSPDGQTLASASADQTIKLWSLDGQLLQTLPGNNGSIWSLAFSPDSKIIASGSQDGTVKLWSREGRLLKTLSGHSGLVSSVSFSPDGKMLASGSEDNSIKLWSVTTGALFKTLTGHSDYVKSVSFSPDSQTLASASSDKTVKLWSLQGVEMQTLDLHQLLVRGCDRLRDYLHTNPLISIEERQLCSR